MGSQFRIQRLIASMPVTAGQPLLQDLPRSYDYESLILRINGGVQVTTAYTSVRQEAPCQTVARIELIADGRNTIYSAPFWYASLAKYDRRANESGSRSTTPPSGAAIATYQVEALGVVDFQTTDGMRGKDSNFRTSGLALWQLRLTFGQPGDMFVGAGAAAFSSMFVEVSSSEMIEVPDASGNRTSPQFLKKVSYQELALPANNVNQEVRLPAGNLIKACVVRTAGATTQDEPSTAVLNNLMAFSGTDVRLNMTSGGLRAKNNMDFGNVTSGYYVFDTVRSGDWFGNLSELWDVTRQAEPKLSLNVNGGSTYKAQVVTTEYLPVASA